MFCWNCGWNNQEDRKVCSQCFSDLRDSTKSGVTRSEITQTAPSVSDLSNKPSATVLSASTDAKRGKSAVVAGAGCGLVVGVSIGLWFVIIGVILCFTGIGAVIGLPLIVAGVAIPFFAAPLGAAMGVAGLDGECPYCGKALSFEAKDVKAGGADCTACKQRILIRDKKFLRVDAR